jgi:hypothetical protein
MTGHEPENGRGHGGLEDEVEDHVALFGREDFPEKAEEQRAHGYYPRDGGDGDSGKDFHKAIILAPSFVFDKTAPAR